MLDQFASDTGLSAGDQTLYLVLGCATTTIYTVEVEVKDVSVLCIESLGGSERTLTLYLAHDPVSGSPMRNTYVMRMGNDY